MTEPDETGRVKEFKLRDGATLDQAIRAFLIAVDQRPELLRQDAGVVVMSALLVSGLASLEVKPEVYTRK